MQFSKAELRLLEQIALGNQKINDLAEALKKDKSQIYRIKKNLEKKNFVILKDNKVNPLPITHVHLLLQELSRRPYFIEDISGCGMKLYFCILNEAKTIEKIEKETGIKRSTLFAKIKTGRSRSFLRLKNNKYKFNKVIWKGVYDFFVALKKYEEVYDNRVPPGAVIYYKTDDEIIFSSKAEFDAELTGFSKYSEYEIKIYPIDYTYYLPRKKLSKKEIFLHSLQRCEKDMNIQNIIILSLFYLKHKKILSGIKHPILDKIDKTIRGEKFDGFPSRAELKDRTDMYDIVLPKINQ